MKKVLLTVFTAVMLTACTGLKEIGDKHKLERKELRTQQKEKRNELKFENKQKTNVLNKKLGKQRQLLAVKQLIELSQFKIDKYNEVIENARIEEANLLAD